MSDRIRSEEADFPLSIHELDPQLQSINHPWRPPSPSPDRETLKLTSGPCIRPRVSTVVEMSRVEAAGALGKLKLIYGGRDGFREFALA